MIRKPLSEVTYSVIGFGNVGSWTGRLLADHGSTLTAVLDHTAVIAAPAFAPGATHPAPDSDSCKTVPQGLDAHALADHVAATGGVKGFPGSVEITADQFYGLHVDLFVPAALEQMIDVEQANLLNCKVIAEAANAPTTPAGEKVLDDRGVHVLPAILCNCGGVTVSYFEWMQNRQSQAWDAARVDDELRNTCAAPPPRSWPPPPNWAATCGPPPSPPPSNTSPTFTKSAASSRKKAKPDVLIIQSGTPEPSSETRFFVSLHRQSPKVVRRGVAAVG